MRIGVNARFLIANKLEGIGWYSYHVIKHIIENHPQHEYVLFFDRKPDPYFSFDSSVKLIQLRPPARHPVLWYIWFEFALPKALKEYKIDVLLSPDGFCSLSTQIPQLMVVHDLAYLHFPEHLPFPVRKYYRYFVPRQIRAASHIIAVSEYTKKDIIDQFDIAEQNISVAYNGVREEFVPIQTDQQKSIKQTYTSGREFFLFVGAIHPRKNLDKLILAFDVFKSRNQNDLALVIVGRKAWMTKETEHAFQNAKYKKDIFLYPYLDTQQLAKLTAASYYAINPSLFEGFGVPVLEALYCNVPVMVSQSSSLPEVAGPGAILFDQNSSDDIALAMQKALTDPNRAKRIELGTLHRVRFNWKNTADKIYYQLLNCMNP